jgi:hypothetical protein
MIFKYILQIELSYHLSSIHRQVPAGSLLNASLVGANTVNGPCIGKIVNILSLLKAATNVV